MRAQRVSIYVGSGLLLLGALRLSYPQLTKHRVEDARIISREIVGETMDDYTRIVHTSKGLFTMDPSFLCGVSEFEATVAFGVLEEGSAYNLTVSGLDVPALGLRPNIVGVRKAL